MGKLAKLSKALTSGHLSEICTFGTKHSGDGDSGQSALLLLLGLARLGLMP
jgi:hypothetical protein